MDDITQEEYDRLRKEARKLLSHNDYTYERRQRLITISEKINKFEQKHKLPLAPRMLSAKRYRELWQEAEHKRDDLERLVEFLEKKDPVIKQMIDIWIKDNT